MICHEYKCIFIHVPKTAGTSIIKAFNLNWDHPDSKFLITGNHSQNEEWKEYEQKYKDYFVFSIVRNPWERFVSGWKYCETTKHKNIEDVLNNLPKATDHVHDYDHITKKQCDILYRNNILIPNLLLRFENLQSDFDKLCDILKKPKTKLPHLNKTSHDHYSCYFTPKISKQLFEPKFHDDIHKLNYNHKKYYP